MSHIEIDGFPFKREEIRYLRKGEFVNHELNKTYYHLVIIFIDNTETQLAYEDEGERDLHLTKTLDVLIN